MVQFAHRFTHVPKFSDFIDVYAQTLTLPLSLALGYTVQFELRKMIVVWTFS